ncbi:MAG: 7-cyano-7-deazaguanine synthase [Candidatus Harrisonbacteria bacterium]|nr:7-cyano-7-deazaguanine synthase [Candidatus Harrisonbacteria bacterium]
MNKCGVVVLLSGGLDSVITAAYLQGKGYPVRAGFFVDRGQSNLEQELLATQKISQRLNIPLLRANFSLPDLKMLLSVGVRKKLGIPARNLILGALALPYTHALSCGMLALGNIASDDLPDCDKGFRMEFSGLISRILGGKIEVVAPLADWENWDKADEINWAQNNNLKDLFSFSWTCWLGGKFHCGNCGACRGRIEGFKKAGIDDPVIYNGGKNG